MLLESEPRGCTQPRRERPWPQLQELKLFLGNVSRWGPHAADFVLKTDYNFAIIVESHLSPENFRLCKARFFAVGLESCICTRLSQPTV